MDSILNFQCRSSPDLYAMYMNLKEERRPDFIFYTCLCTCVYHSRTEKPWWWKNFGNETFFHVTTYLFSVQYMCDLYSFDGLYTESRMQFDAKCICTWSRGEVLISYPAVVYVHACITSEQKNLDSEKILVIQHSLMWQLLFSLQCISNLSLINRLYTEFWMSFASRCIPYVYALDGGAGSRFHTLHLFMYICVSLANRKTLMVKKFW